MPDERSTAVKILRAAALIGSGLGFGALLIAAESYGITVLETGAVALLNIFAFLMALLGVYAAMARLKGRELRHCDRVLPKGSLADCVILALLIIGSPTVLVLSAWSLASLAP